MNKQIGDMTNDELMDFIIELQEENSRYERKLDRLTNNWNELRQHIKDYLKEWENSDDEWVKGKCDMARDILYDMEEIKGDARYD